MRNQIDLRESGPIHIPTVGLHRNVVFQQQAGLGAPVHPPLVLCLFRAQPSVDLPGHTVRRSLGNTPTWPSVPCATLLKNASESGYILNGATIPPSVTF